MFGDNANVLEECTFLLLVFVGLAWWVRWERKREEKGDDKGDAVYYEAQRKGFRSPTASSNAPSPGPAAREVSLKPV